MWNKTLKQIKKEVKVSTDIVKIPEALTEKLKPFGPRFIKVEQPIPNDRHSGKKAFERRFQDRPYEANHPELQEWLAAGGNYGVLAGKGLILIDTDSKKANDKLKDINTLKVRSGSKRGYCWLFRSDVTDNGTIIDPEIKDPRKRNIGNVQADNKYVVGAGCNHFTGGKYKIVNDVDIAWISKKELEKLFGDLLHWTGDTRRLLEEQARFEEEQIGVPIPMKDLIDLSQLTLTSRGEYQGCHPLHGSMTGQNFCVDPEKNCWHCFRCNSGGGGLMWIALENGLLQCHECQKGALRGENFVQAIKMAQEMGFDVKLFDEDLSPDVERFFDTEGKKKKFVPAYVAKELMDEYQYVTRKKDKTVFRYDPEKGVYNLYGEAHIERMIRKKIAKHTSTGRQREIINFVQISTLQDLEDAPQHLIVLQNGVLNLKNGQIKEFNPDHFILNALPVNYDKNAKCPNFLKFLDEVVTKEDQKTIQEFCGYCFLRDYRHHKALLLVGEGANGKSTFLEVLRKILGSENVATEPLQTLVTNRFALSQLYGKLANIYPDLPNMALKNTGFFKMITGNDTLSAEYKYKDRFNFKNYGKLIFSCNAIPETPDDTVAFFRRWIIINFPNQFLEDDPKTDKNILHKLTTPQELSGILNWMLTGLKRLIKNDGFATSKTVEETRKQYIEASDPIKAFAEQQLAPAPNNHIPKDDVYDAFIRYCTERNLPTCPKNTFSMRLPQHATASPGKCKKLGKVVRCWSGIELVDGVDEVDGISKLFKSSEKK